MAVKQYGKGFVFGIRDLKPLYGFPPGKIRIRLRPNDFMKVYVRDSMGIRAFAVVDEDGYWKCGHELGRNLRLTSQFQPLTPEQQ